MTMKMAPSCSPRVSSEHVDFYFEGSVSKSDSGQCKFMIQVGQYPYPVAQRHGNKPGVRARVFQSTSPLTSDCLL